MQEGSPFLSQYVMGKWRSSEKFAQVQAIRVGLDLDTFQWIRRVASVSEAPCIKSALCITLLEDSAE